MGGQSVKRRKVKRDLEVWAWWPSWSCFVSLSDIEPTKDDDGDWDAVDTAGICLRIFERLTGRKPRQGADPVKVRIPAWTVVEAKAKR